MGKISSIDVKPRRVCSVDASTNSLAFAIFDGISLESSGKINFAGSSTYAKVSDAARKTVAFLKHFEIDSIVIEHTVFINSPKTAADLALVQGAILAAASLNGIRIGGSINPISWQSYIGNNRLTSAEKQNLMAEFPDKSKAWYSNKAREIRKERTIKFVNTYYDKKVLDNDVADAIGVGHWAISNWGKLTR